MNETILWIKISKMGTGIASRAIPSSESPKEGLAMSVTLAHTACMSDAPAGTKELHIAVNILAGQAKDRGVQRLLVICSCREFSSRQLHDFDPKTSVLPSTKIGLWKGVHIPAVKGYAADGI